MVFYAGGAAVSNALSYGKDAFQRIIYSKSFYENNYCRCTRTIGKHLWQTLEDNKF